MKKLMFLLFAAFLAFNACKQESDAGIDLKVLEQSMNADPEVAKMRTLFFSHTRLLAAIPDLKSVNDQLHSCGLYGSTASSEELDRCLSEHPLKEQYMEFQAESLAYDNQMKVVKQRFPEFERLSPEQRAQLILVDLDKHAEEVLSDYLSKSKK